MKKKLIASILAVSMMATLAVGMTLAYFTDSKQTDNTFTVGNVKIELTEPAWESSGRIDGGTVYAGEPLAKDPTVKNVGANPCFVRIKVEGLNQFVDSYPKSADNKIRYRNADYQLGGVNADWEVHGDYIYYKHVLNLNETTLTPAFSSIVMPTCLTNADNIWENHNVTVKAEAVQAQGALPSFNDVKLMSVNQIATWFATCGL